MKYSFTAWNYSMEILLDFTIMKKKWLKMRVSFEFTHSLFVSYQLFHFKWKLQGLPSSFHVCMFHSHLYLLTWFNGKNLSQSCLRCLYSFKIKLQKLIGHQKWNYFCVNPLLVKVAYFIVKHGASSKVTKCQWNRCVTMPYCQRKNQYFRNFKFSTPNLA